MSAGSSDRPGPAPVLILGGTTEARELAEALDRRPETRPVTSLAGRVADPRALQGEVRIGGFGGSPGLATWISANGIRTVVDATHPFAAGISANAAAACAVAGVPLIALRRPGWIAGPGDDWHDAADLTDAASQVAARVAGAGRAAEVGGVAGTGQAAEVARSGGPGRSAEVARSWGSGRSAEVARSWGSGRSAEVARSSGPGPRVLLAIGRQEVGAFAGIDGAWFLIRAIEEPTRPLPCRHEVVLARGPYGLEQERALLADHAIDLIVTKDAGGDATRAKLDAAREREIPVVMVRRPALPEGPAIVVVPTADDAARAVDRVLGARDA